MTLLGLLDRNRWGLRFVFRHKVRIAGEGTSVTLRAAHIPTAPRRLRGWRHGGGPWICALVESATLEFSQITFYQQ